MNEEQVNQLLKGQVIKKITRSCTSSWDSYDPNDDCESAIASDRIDIEFESGLLLYLTAEVWDYGDAYGISIQGIEK